MKCKYCKSEAETGDEYCILCREKIEEDWLERRIEREEKYRSEEDQQ